MTSASIGHIKGVSFLSAKRYVEQSGQRRWEEVMAALPADERSVAGEAVVVGWYPVGVYSSLLRAIDRTLGQGNGAALVPLGRFQAEHDLNLFYRLVLRFWSPAILIEKTAEMWGRYHDTGVWDVKRVTATVSQWLGASDVVCPSTVAYIGRLFELVGAKGVQAHHPECVARGGRRCTWTVDWK